MQTMRELNVQDKRRERKRSAVIVRGLSVLMAGVLVCGGLQEAFARTNSSDTGIGVSTPYANRAGSPVNRINHVDSDTGEWLLKWREGAQRDAAVLPDTVFISRQEKAGVDVVAPADGIDRKAWLAALQSHPDVAYVHPNGKVKLLAAAEAAAKPVNGNAAAAGTVLEPANASANETANRPDDPYLQRQSYLSLIGADRAWQQHGYVSSDLTIALIDTGVDLDHPDLKDNLVPGLNLVQPNKPPEDDNGHGTKVAGVLAAAGNNGTGTTGVLWKARIMPIKALDADGYGEENKLGEAIVHAVDAGAKIVVLSVGLYQYSPYLHDIALYAESRDVLLVAASGNDGLLHGDKAAVKYPAAYPTVLAVSGAAPDGSPERRANAGPEIDLAAAWNVYTTALGGGYQAEEGTSMAAPQAAAAAALVWEKEPHLKAYQVRERLMQTAKDIGPAGRDNQSGAGLLQIDAALSAEGVEDGGEPNDKRSQASPLPVANQAAGILDGGTDVDWFRIDVPHDGDLTVAFQGWPASGDSAHPTVTAALHYADGTVQTADWRPGAARAEWKVHEGRHWLEIRFRSEAETIALPYVLTTDFRMAADDYEPNDAPANAYPLPEGVTEVTGTFHKQGDEDWYRVTFNRPGDLRLALSVDTMRIDPALLIRPDKGVEQRIDDYGKGMTERTSLPVQPGSYLIRVRNAVSASAPPVVGTYTLAIEFEQRHEDPNEPNDRFYTATPLVPGVEYRGVFAAAGDEDWFRLNLDRHSLAQLMLDGVPVDRRVRMEVFDKRQQLLFSMETAAGQEGLQSHREYAEGVYYIRLTSDRPFDRALYRLQAIVTPLAAGFHDVAGHWAEHAIISLHERGIVSGTGPYRFEPDRTITRAEAAALIVRSFGASLEPSAGVPAYRDLDRSHWAYETIVKATAAGIVNGLPDGNFGPDRPVTRAEIAVMIGRALKLPPHPSASAVFADLDPDHWAAPMILRLREAALLNGYPGNTVRPDQQASRAEFSAILYRALEERGLS